jgi:Ca2+-binding EF-hand superfamily protein
MSEKKSSALPDKDQQLFEVFAIVDADKSGHIDMNELFAMIRLIKPGSTKEELQKIFNTMDTTKDKKVSKEEFAGYFKDLFKADNPQEFFERISTTRRYLERKPALANVFDKFDVDRSGHLDKSEMFRMVKLCQPKATSDELTVLLKKLDTDNDEKISKIEFVGYYFKVFALDDDISFKERIETTFNGRRRVKLQSVFNGYDLNNDGVLDLAEFSNMLKMNGKKFVTPEQIQETLVKIDKNKDKKVDFGEWMAYMEALIAYMDDEKFNLAVHNMMGAAKPAASAPAPKKEEQKEVKKN